MLLRRLAWLGAMISTIVVALVTCTDDSPKVAESSDSGAEAAVVAAGQCPSNAPVAGDGCAFPEGTTCSFGTCNAVIAECTKGVWRFGTNVGTAPSCPSDFPQTGAACPTCFPADLSCNYGSTDCSLPDASTNRSVASCPKGVWEIETFPCSDASSIGAPQDAGADVQGDAGPDVD